MKLYNLVSCKSFVEANEKITMDFGPCASARLVLVAIFFINALVRKWGGEEIGIEYNFWWGMGGGFIGYLLPLMLTGNLLISFIIGVALMLLGGYGSGLIMGGENYGYED